jgi:hypothetical protein
MAEGWFYSFHMDFQKSNPATEDIGKEDFLLPCDARAGKKKRALLQPGWCEQRRWGGDGAGEEKRLGRKEGTRGVTAPSRRTVAPETPRHLRGGIKKLELRGALEGPLGKLKDTRDTTMSGMESPRRRERGRESRVSSVGE